MLKRLRTAWHKASAISALQTYFEQPFKEPFERQHELQLVRLSEKGIAEGVSPIDTALRFYAEFAAEQVTAGVPLNEIGYPTVGARMMALRDKIDCYDEHRQALKAVANAQE